MGTTLEPKKLRKTFVNIISQNVRGFSDEKEEEIIDCMGKHKHYNCSYDSSSHFNRQSP